MKNLSFALENGLSKKEYKLKKPLHKSKSEGLKLSLITSCYNAEKFLDELADSIIGQNFDNWESRIFRPYCC